METASECAEFPVQAGNDLSAKWPSEGMRATDARKKTKGGDAVSASAQPTLSKAQDDSFEFSWNPGSDANTARAISTIGTDRSCDVR